MHRKDLLEIFPGYDYLNPKQPYLLDYRRPDNITGKQMEAFHFFWSKRMCIETGKIGLSLITPHIPNCLCVSNKEGSGVHIVHDLSSIDKLFLPESISLILASACLPLLPCTRLPESASAEEKRLLYCKGEEIIPTIKAWSKVLSKDGVLAAVLIDEQFARQAGFSLFEKGPFRHVWSAEKFCGLIEDLKDTFEVVEFNNLHNHFSFNVVLKKL